MTTQAMDILVTLDEHYLHPLHVMLVSLRMNNPHQPIRVWLIHQSIPEGCLIELEGLTADLDLQLKVLTMDHEISLGASTVKEYPLEMYFRLLCADILPETLERILYLDPDTLIINPLKDLWELDLEGKMFAAASHEGLMRLSYPINHMRLRMKTDYYNSGVLLMDLVQMRQKVKLADINQVIETMGERLFLPDQDILNYLYGPDIYAIPEERWNYDTRDGLIHYTKTLGEVTTTWTMENTSILHFCGRPKPWNPSSKNRFATLFQHYQQILRRDYLTDSKSFN